MEYLSKASRNISAHSEIRFTSSRVVNVWLPVRISRGKSRPRLSAIFVECAVTYSYLPFSSDATEVEMKVYNAPQIQIRYLESNPHISILISRTADITLTKLNSRDTIALNSITMIDSLSFHFTKQIDLSDLDLSNTQNKFS